MNDESHIKNSTNNRKNKIILTKIRNFQTFRP